MKHFVIEDLEMDVNLDKDASATVFGGDWTQRNWARDEFLGTIVDTDDLDNDGLTNELLQVVEPVYHVVTMTEQRDSNARRYYEVGFFGLP